ncbi:hypothetical protein NQ317_010669 [Molorchus minor]|uniref:beta-mannosidase n=1 Tax=Molorchus minor TaxID=1323400 RepID=A0ABQ9K8Q2_9CUCU|nr:hypothetical protein NQ317_010669 [Molorchus minor]
MAHVYARPHHMLQTEEEVLDIVEDDPSTSTREIARQSVIDVLQLTMACRISILIFSVLITFCSSDNILDLGGKWLVKEASGSKYLYVVNMKIWKLLCQGGIYSDLMNNGIIDDIYYGANDDETRWVPRSNWTYYTTFTVHEDLLKFENIKLVFDGLDTFASVFVNDVKVGESINMFVQYVFDIKQDLKVGNNTIEVQFLSPILIAESINAEQNKSYSIPLNCPPNEYRGECHANMIRKMQASFAWDWGPSFPSMGIWKNVYIQAYHETVIRYVVTETIENTDNWVLNIDTYFANNTKQKVDGKVSFLLSLGSVNITRTVDVSESLNEYGDIVLSESMQFSKWFSTLSRAANFMFHAFKEYVNTWWPNGYGGHDLYDLTTTFSTTGESETSTKTNRVGFRTIELVQDTITLV